MSRRLPRYVPGDNWPTEFNGRGVSGFEVSELGGRIATATPANSDTTARTTTATTRRRRASDRPRRRM